MRPAQGGRLRTGFIARNRRGHACNNRAACALCPSTRSSPPRCGAPRERNAGERLSAVFGPARGKCSPGLTYSGTDLLPKRADSSSCRRQLPGPRFFNKRSVLHHLTFLLQFWLLLLSDQVPRTVTSLLGVAHQVAVDEAVARAVGLPQAGGGGWGREVSAEKDGGDESAREGRGGAAGAARTPSPRARWPRRRSPSCPSR